MSAPEFMRIAALNLLLLVSASWLAPAQVTTYHYNNARTGATLNETILNTSNVNTNTFGKLFSLFVDGQIYAQPLYVPKVAIPRQGVHNVLYVATEHNSVYAFDADSQEAPLWQVSLGPSMPATACCALRDLLPEIGITSTPVIDLSSGTLYVVAESYENQVTFFRLHALDITTGADKLTPAVIQGSVSGTSPDSTGGILAFNPIQHWQRPGLLLLNGNIYIAFASHQDSTPYHGWLFGYGETTLQQTGILCFSPNGEENGVWQGGVGLAADASGNIYLETGNGPFDVNLGGRDYGDSIVKIGTASGLTILDYFAPSTEVSDQDNDWDLGSSGPLLIPGTSLGVAGGKDGKLYVFSTGNLGQFNSAGDRLVQEWQATFSYSSGQAGGFWGGNYLYYNSTLYGFGERDYLKAFSFNGSQFNTTPTSQSTFQVPSGVSDDPAMSISANGTVSGTGIVWAAYSSNGKADGNPYPGVLLAFDASDVTHELWNSNQNSSRDYSGNWAKWAPPTVANGKVYLPTFDSLLNVYGLLPVETITATAGTPQSTIINTTFATALQATVKNAGNNPLSGVTVTFTAPSTGASATFSGSATATATTNASGIAAAPALTANGQAGAYAITATAAGAVAANFNLTNTAISTGVGSLSGAGNSSTTAFNLTAEGTADWVHWGDAALNRKSAVTPQIGNYAEVGSGSVQKYSNDLRVLSWTDGAPTASGSNENGLYINSLQNGFSFTAPADTNTRNLTVHVGGWMSGGTFTAHLSDGSAADYVDTTATVNGQYDRNYTLTYAAASTGQTLKISWVTTSGTGNVTLNGAALSLAGPNVTATSGTPQSTIVNTTFATALQATVKDARNNPLSGVTVTFTAPGTGASATFSGSATATATTNASGIAAAPALTANGQAGAYTITATAAGAVAANFNLTNTASSTGGSGSLSGSGNSSTTAVNLTAEGTADWVHWGDAALNRKSAVTPQIGNYTEVGSGTVQKYSNDPRALNWTDGTPTASGSNENGLYINSLQNGFSFTAPADTSARTLTVHVGGWMSGGTLTAHLSDGSAADYVDTTATVNGQYDRNYTLTYAAASTGQTLKISWVTTSGTGNVTLNGTALSLSGPNVTASGGTPPIQ